MNTPIQFYHINRIEAGYAAFQDQETILIGNELNPTGRFVFCHAKIKTGFDSYFSQTTPEACLEILLQQLRKTPPEYYARSNHIKARHEIYFEAVRYHSFPNLPSRLKCLYGCTTKSAAVEWGKTISAADVCLCEGLGEVHIADSSFWGFTPGDLQQIERDAQAYWQGNGENGLKELLFTGLVSIVRHESLSSTTP